MAPQSGRLYIFPSCNPPRYAACSSIFSSPRGTERCLLRRWSLPTIPRFSSPMPAWCSSSAPFWGRSSATTRAPPPARSVCARAASTTTSSRWATPSGTTPSSRCWATSPSAITSSGTPSPSPGSSSPARQYLGIPPDRLRVTVHHTDEEARGLLARDRRTARPPDLRIGRQGQLLADGRHGAVRAVHGDLRRPRVVGGQAVGRRRTASRFRRPSSRPSPRPAASSRSGTSCSCSSIARRTEPSRRCRSRRWTRGPGWSGSPR